ncbi:hypothetical protein NLJ89_g120 [Agrocybe chaxingu]|uniref:Uncharacterized protein n=1 Tax=Agrocybe chaxingu TaxID=84603 RepID=A0A9W8N2J3_9AGAR|nr:hypothetical protein NLJ89_g120 [Agrocybe chaxingu]
MFRQGTSSDLLMLSPESSKSSPSRPSDDYSWIPPPLFSPRVVEQPADVASPLPERPGDGPWAAWPARPDPDTISGNRTGAFRNLGAGRVDLDHADRDSLDERPPRKKQKTVSSSTEPDDERRPSTPIPLDQVPSVKVPKTQREATSQLAHALNSVFAEAASSPKQNASPNPDVDSPLPGHLTSFHSRDRGDRVPSRHFRPPLQTSQPSASTSVSGTSSLHSLVSRHAAPVPEHVATASLAQAAPATESENLFRSELVENDKDTLVLDFIHQGPSTSAIQESIEDHPFVTPYRHIQRELLHERQPGLDPHYPFIPELIPAPTSSSARIHESDGGDYVPHRPLAFGPRSPLSSLTTPRVSRRARPDPEEESFYEADLDELEIWAQADIATTSFVKLKEGEVENLERAARMSLRFLQRVVDAAMRNPVPQEKPTVFKQTVAIPSISHFERSDRLIDEIFGPSEKIRGYTRPRPPTSQKNLSNASSTPVEVPTPNAEERDDLFGDNSHAGPSSSSALPAHDDLEYLFSGPDDVGEDQVDQVDQARDMLTPDHELLLPTSSAKNQQHPVFFPSSNPLTSFSRPLVYTPSPPHHKPLDAEPLPPIYAEGPELPSEPLSPSPSHSPPPSHVQDTDVQEIENDRQSPEVEYELSPMALRLQNARTLSPDIESTSLPATHSHQPTPGHSPLQIRGVESLPKDLSTDVLDPQRDSISVVKNSVDPTPTSFLPVDLYIDEVLPKAVRELTPLEIPVDGVATELAPEGPFTPPLEEPIDGPSTTVKEDPSSREQSVAPTASPDHLTTPTAAEEPSVELIVAPNIEEREDTSSPILNALDLPNTWDNVVTPGNSDLHVQSLDHLPIETVPREPSLPLETTAAETDPREEPLPLDPAPVDARPPSVPAIETLVLPNPNPDLAPSTSSSTLKPSTPKPSNVFVAGDEHMFEMSEAPSTPISSRIPTIFDSDYLQPRYRDLWSAEERARFQMVTIELEPEATMWHEELVEVYDLDQEMKVEDLGDENAVAKEEEEESGDEEVEEAVVSETQPESASRAGRKRRRPRLGSPRKSKRKLARTASGARPEFIDVDGDDLPSIAVKAEDTSNGSQKQEDGDEEEEGEEEEDELENEDDELVDPPDGLAEKVEEWVTALQTLVKGKKRLRQQDLLNLKAYLKDIRVHQTHFKPASKLAQTVFAVSQLDANDVPFKDTLGLRALARKSVQGWGIRKLRKDTDKSVRSGLVLLAASSFSSTTMLEKGSEHEAPGLLTLQYGILFEILKVVSFRDILRVLQASQLPQPQDLKADV